MEIKEYLEKQQKFDTDESQNTNYDLLVKFVTVWIKDREPEKYQEIASSAETPSDTDSSGYNEPF